MELKLDHVITRDNFESALDSGNLFAAMNSGRWWQMRRNGRTQTWKRDASRIRVPFKVGLKGTGAIDETHFNLDGTLRSDLFRHRDDIPQSARSN